MDPLSIAASITGVLTFGYTIGSVVFSLRSALSLAAIEFELFVQETDQFILLWKLVEPYTAGPQPYVSEESVEELGRVHRGAVKILNEFHQTIQTLQQEDRKFIFHRLQTAGQSGRLAISQSNWVPSPEIRVNRLRAYFNKDHIRLQRDQLQYAKGHLNTILTFIR